MQYMAVPAWRKYQESANTSTKNNSSDRTALELNELFSMLSPKLNSVVEAAQDIFSTGALYKNQLGKDTRILTGYVVYSVPYTHWYRVSLEGGCGELPCCAMTGSSGVGVIGPKSGSMIPPGSRVIVLLPRGEDDHWGMIIGTYPDKVEDGNFVFPDCIVRGSNTGLYKERYYKEMMTLLGDEGGIIDFSNGRPSDGNIFDWNVFTETGIGIHIDPMMFMLRVDELCGITGFYFDQLLRISGFNLETISGAHFESFKNDEGECSYFRGESIYPWEGLGVFRRTLAALREESDPEKVRDRLHAKLEPKETTQTAFHRYQEYGGYLGQGRIRTVAIPPAGLGNSSTVYDLNNSDPVIGVFREHIGLDGSYSLESAKSIIIAKRSLIPVPKRIKSDDSYQTDSDNAEANNYKFSGEYADGDAVDHKIGDIVAPEDAENTNLLKQSSIGELHAHTFNWRALHAFHYHTGDFDLPDESELPLGSNEVIPPFSSFVDQTWMPEPTPVQQYVDHRHANVDYYKVLSAISITDDGDMVIQAGGGSEIRLIKGNIILSCPGNIIMQSGKSTVTMAGDDAVIRANNSVDITSSEKDVRIKAEKNLQILGGNSGQGGVLIESRSLNKLHDYPSTGGEDIKSSGVVVKCPNSQFATMASEIYLRTGSADGSIQPGPVVIDVDGKGSGNEFRLICSSAYRHIVSEAVDTFGAWDSPITCSVYNSSIARIGTSAEIMGNTDVTGSVRATSSIISVDGAFYSGPSEGDVLKLSNRNLARSQQLRIVDNVTQQTEIQLQSWIDDVQGTYYDEGQIGASGQQIDISFSLRNEEQYGTTNFVLPQSYWQQLAELDSAGTKYWTETEVVYQVDYNKQMPWPGIEKWKNEETFLTKDYSADSIYDISSGCAKGRTEHQEKYEEAEFSPFVKEKPATSYRVIDVP